MSKRLPCAALLAAVVLAAPAAAKPPDLPVQFEDWFAPETLGAQPPAMPCRWISDADEPQADEGSNCCADLCAALADVWNAVAAYLNGTDWSPESTSQLTDDGLNAIVVQVQETVTGEFRFGPGVNSDSGIVGNIICNEEEPTTSARHRSARHMFHVGEACFRKGDLDMAHNCFEETRLIAPNSPYARRAESRLQEVAARKAEVSDDASEAQEPAVEAAQAEGDAVSEAARLHSAWQMYGIGQRCQLIGDWAMAVNCYHETRLIYPHSLPARLAAQRLRQVKAERAAAEEAEAGTEEPPQTDPQNNSKNEGSIELEIILDGVSAAGQIKKVKWPQDASSPAILWVKPSPQNLRIEEEPTTPGR
jgi:hypothetical protein